MMTVTSSWGFLGRMDNGTGMSYVEIYLTGGYEREIPPVSHHVAFAVEPHLIRRSFFVLKVALVGMCNAYNTPPHKITVAGNRLTLRDEST